MSRDQDKGPWDRKYGKERNETAPRFPAFLFTLGCAWRAGDFG